MSTTFDVTITLTPHLLAGTPLLTRPADAVEAVRGAVENMAGAAWIDVAWLNVPGGPWPVVERITVRGADDEAHEGALRSVVEMVAKRALEVCAERARRAVVEQAPNMTAREAEQVAFMGQRLKRAS